MKDGMISIIMPVYNSEKFLLKAINSVLQQTYENFELIIVNDGSTDNSEQVLNTITDSRIKYYSIDNSGPSTARNIGIQKAVGDYIQFIDSDDYLEIDAMENLVKMIKGTDWAIASYTVIQGNKARNVKVDYEGIYSKDFIIQNYIEFFERQVIRHIGNKLYKKEIIDKTDLRFNKDIKRGEAIVFNINYLKNTKNVYLSNTTMYNYFDNDLSITSSYLPTFVQQTEIVFDEIQSFLLKSSVEVDNYNHLDSMYAYRLISYVSVLFNKQNNLSKKQIFNEIKKITNNNKFEQAIDHFKPINGKMKLLKILFKHKLNRLIYVVFATNESKK